MLDIIENFSSSYHTPLPNKYRSVRVVPISNKLISIADITIAGNASKKLRQISNLQNREGIRWASLQLQVERLSSCLI